MKFNKLFIIYNYFIYLISLISCQTENFVVKGRIQVYENTKPLNVCCQGQCIDYSSSYLPNKYYYTFNFNITALAMTIEISIQNKEYIPGSRIGAIISSSINSANHSCGSPSLFSEVIYLNNSVTRYYMRIQNHTKFFELPDNKTGTYRINFNYGFKEKYICNSQSSFIKKNISSSFYLSNLVTTAENVNSECCNQYNATITGFDSGFTMNETEGLIINTTYENPHFPENAKKVNFMYDEIGCYYFQFLLSQENYKTISTCSKSYIICYKVCETCYDCNGNEIEHKCQQCVSGYYKKVDGNNNCYTEEEKRQLFPNYFLNKDINKFDKCYFSCGTCRLKGNNYKHKCDTCAENYYPTEGNEYLFNCYSEEDKPKNYYFDEEKKLFVKCNPTCDGCIGKGDSKNNNCTSCIKYHHFSNIENSNCIMEGTQPVNFFLDIANNSYRECFERCKTCSKYKDETSENCLSCDQEEGYYLIYNQPGNCVDDKPGPDYYLNPINLIEKKFEKCNINFCAECSNNEWYYISRYIGNSFHCENTNDGGGVFNMQIYKNNEPLLNESQSYINISDISNCEIRLRNNSQIGKREEIIVVKKDYIDLYNKEINRIEYDFYKKRKNTNNLALSTLLNITYCDDLDFLITIPRNLSNYYSNKYIKIIKNALEKFNYDLFNPKEPFYNDICLSFFIGLADLSLKDRTSLYLENNLCPQNCIYDSIKYINDNYFSEINCICNRENINNENFSQIYLKNNYFIKNNVTNIGIIRCYNSFGDAFNFKFFNISFVLYLIILAIYIFLIFRYFLIDKHKFRAKIFESLKKSHSAYCKLERNDSFILNERLESYNNNNFINYNTKILALKVSDEVNLNNMPYDYSLVNDNRNFISIFFSILKDTDFLFGIFFKKNKFKIFSLSIGIFIHHVNFMLILNSILIFDNIISYKFLYDIFPIEKIVINSIILICIHLVFVKFVYKYCDISEKLMDFLIEEYRNESFYFSRIQNFVIAKHQKIIIIFAVSFILISFGIYYNIIFCHIFVKTQIIWILQIIFCCFGSLLINIVFCLIITTLRIFSFKYQSLYIYNSSLILKGILNRD